MSAFAASPEADVLPHRSVPDPRPARPRGLRATSPTLLFAALAASVIAAGCGNSPASAPPASRTFRVETAVVEVRDVLVTVDAVGTAYASGQVDVRPQISAVLLDAPFLEGDLVEEGAVLARFDDGKAKASLALSQAKLDSARARVAVARERLERYRRLAAEDLVSREEFATLDAEHKEAEASVRENQAEVRLAERNLADFTLHAPISGRMGIRYVDVGNFVEAGTVIATLVQVHPVEVVFAVPNAELEGLEVGQTVVVKDTAGTELDRGRLRVIDARVDPDTRMVSLKAVVPNEGDTLRAGQFVTVSLVRERRERAVVAPEEAVVPYAGKTYVFVVEGDEARRREVTLGVRQPGAVQIVSGLSAGEVIVTRGQHRLSDGSKVAVADESDDPQAGAS